MNRRRTIVLGVAATVFLLAMTAGAFATLPLSYDERDPEGGFGGVPNERGYDATAELRGDGDRLFAFTANISESDTSYYEMRGGDQEEPTEYYYADNTSYVYYPHATVADPDWTIPDRVDVLYETDDGVVGEDPDARPHLEEEVELMNRLVVSNINHPPYEHIDTRESASRTIEVYEPQDAWRDGSRPYRLTNTGGEVKIDAETGEVLFVDITYDMTRAETYADFHLTDNETVTIEITYAFDGDGGGADEPTWVR